jgi:hypothetical protein
MLESDADRLGMIRAVGEQFDTGHTSRLWMVFDETFLETDVNGFVVSNREPRGEARTSDVEAHELIKDSRITRVSDGSVWFVKDLEPDGTGMTLVRLRK